MAKFRKRPVVIEATRWFTNGDHPADFLADRAGLQDGDLVTFSGAHAKAHAWEGGVVRYFRRPDVDGKMLCPSCAKTMHEHGWIDTPEGGLTVCPGDWVVTGIQGERYPVKPAVFEATYETVEESAF